jgi:hypothetical protein
MPITVACPCGRQLQIADAFAGQQGRCPVCGRTLDLPMPVETGLPPVAAEDVRSDAATELNDEQVRTEKPPSRDVREQSPTEFTPELEVAAPSYKLFSAGDATLAAFLGSILAGFVILALNYRRLGRKGAAGLALLIGLAALLLHFTIAFTLPDPLSVGISLALTLLGLGVVHVVAKAAQGDAFDEHQRRGGQKASTGAAAGIGLLCLVLVFAIAMGLSSAWYALFNDLGERIEFGKDEEIYYAKGVTEGQARALGRFLQQDGFFNGRGAKTVTVARQGDTFLVSFVVVRDTWNRPDALEWFRKVDAEMSDHVFGGAPVEIRLLDENLTLQKTIK